MSVELPVAQWDELWLPLRPYATNQLWEGIRRERRPVAMTRRYVEANPSALSNLLVVDVDHSDAVLRAVSSVGSHPLPNAVVENPVNGHAHAVWALEEAVTRTEYARRKPLAYAAAVTEGLRRALEGDAAYSGLMTKNPLHTDWSTEWLHGGLHTLGGLEEALGGHMPPVRWRETKRFRTNISGLGRNCSIFETARTWAYREVRHHFGSPDTLHTAIHAEVHTRNAEFTEPLPAVEARAIANSIHRWITTRSRMWKDGAAVYEATFIAIQSARGKKGGAKGGKTSGQVRAARRDERAAAMLEYMRGTS
ncbi:replication initiation protein [Streptomyces anulatus]|uniref:replication initiation protein n=1 Tax=Streptomyces anulatus TaxID=1892 RepID=UPI0022583CC6|nr:replication initiation protein [Streptomyces anulatus]MCX4523587.1 replication initiation protein [Streptomyces anulatus]MCX4523716.1 replication initiation protein [Streptomyces anulatus]MCX4606905.1 replication initiation protein [Streptomyces anulatus]WTD15406.1 replication initiation protein [Streptomyces anulatus]WTD30583.1 replication initiation protein [Streptomyces anulatus]